MKPEQPLRAARKAKGLCYRCDAPAFRAGRCERHYAETLASNLRRARERRFLGPSQRPSVADRFWSKVDKTGGPDACWPWKAGVYQRGGYGQFRVKRSGRAHRVAWQLTNGPIPDGLFVCHRCDNPPCCNPAHLFLGTAADNNADMAAKGRAPGRPKLTASDVGALIEMYEAGSTLHEIAAHFGISYRAASQAASGDTWARLRTERAAGGTQ